MENAAANSGGSAKPDASQRKIELHHAAIEVDGKALARTARFTDGSTRAVRMEWSGITRVGAFRCDDGAAGLVCLAVTDPANVVILDERMEGWSSLGEALAESLPGVPPASGWRERVIQPETGANWTVLFQSQ
jgi:hypothetical protein